MTQHRSFEGEISYVECEERFNSTVKCSTRYTRRDHYFNVINVCFIVVKYVVAMMLVWTHQASAITREPLLLQCTLKLIVRNNIICTVEGSPFLNTLFLVNMHG